MNNTKSSSRRPSDDEIARAVPQAARVREVRVGIFVILGLAGFFVILFMMTSPATFRGRYTVLTHVDDAGGMRRGDAVTMRGVNIGRVRAFDLTQETGVLLSLEIERGWDIPVGSRTEVRSTGFLGGMVVAVVTGPGPGFVEPGTLLPGEAVAGVLDVAGDMSDDFMDLLARSRAFLSDSTIAGTEGAVMEVRDLFSAVAARLDTADSLAAEARFVLQDLRRAAANVEDLTGAEEWRDALASAEATLASLERSSAGFEETVASLNTVLGRIERGEGTLGKLLVSDSLYNAYTDLAVTLRELADDVKENPRRYISLRIF